MQALASRISLVQPEKKAVFPYSNSIYVEGDSRVLIDAGSGYGAYREPIAKGVDLVLLSHYHFDHTNGLEYFPGAQIMASYEELWAYTDEDAYTASTGYHIWDDLMDVPRKNVFASTFVQPDDVPTMPGFRRIELNGCFRDNDRFDLGGTSIQAIHTPGHAPGHYSFYFPDEGILFAGDYDLSPWGPWYGALVSDFDLLADSVERLIALQPRMIVSSHRQHIYTENLAEQMRAFLEAPLQKGSPDYGISCRAATVKRRAGPGFYRGISAPQLLSGLLEPHDGEKTPGSTVEEGLYYKSKRRFLRSKRRRIV